jgi:hypothetical protein
MGHGWATDGPRMGHGQKMGYACKRNPLILLVGAAGFEPATPAV